LRVALSAGGIILNVPAKKTLLLVEDEVIIAMAQKAQLEKYGYSVLLASSGEKAISLFAESTDIQLVLMDIDLGSGIDGTAAAALILDIRDVPVVFLSSHTESAVVEKTEKISSYGYVVKNSGMTVLDASIKMAFKLFEANRKITANEIKLNSLISNIDDVIAVLDGKGVISYVSPNIEKWFGWKPDEQVSVSAMDFVHPDDAQRIRTDFAAIRGPGAGPKLMDCKFRCSDGTFRPVELTVTNLLHDPVIDGILLSFHDISGRRRAEEKLQEKNEEYEVLNEELRSSLEELQTANEVLTLNSEALRAKEKALGDEIRFNQALLESMPGYLYVYDETGRLIRWNKKHEEMTGYSAEELSQMTLADWYEGEDAVRVAAAVENVFKNGFGEVEAQLITKSRKKLLIRSNGVPLVIDGKRYFTGVGIDITESRRGAEERSLNEARLKRLVEILQHPAETIQEFLDFALAQAIELTGSRIGYIYHYNEDRKEFILNTWSRQVMAECTVIDPQTTYALEKTGIWGEAVRQRKPIVVNAFEEPNPLRKGIPEGHVRMTKFMTVPIFRNKQIMGVIGLANKESDYTESDILQVSLLMDAIWKVTERKLAEEEVKTLLAEKELILKEVHHRIKNNMNTIYSLLTLQAGMISDTAASDALEDAGRRVQSMMLLYGKLYQSSDVTSLSLQQFIPDLAHQIVSNFPNGAGVRLELDIDDFCLEAKQLQPVGILINELVTNSMKYAFAGRTEGIVSITARRDGTLISLVIADNGVGIPESIGFEVSPGFGLVLVAGLASQLGGSLRLERSGGTRILLEFAQ